MIAMRQPALTLAVLAALGCNSGETPQPAFGDLYPVRGVVKRGGQPVKGGVVQFTPNPDRPEFLINSLVGDDGTFTLTTVRMTDKQGERKTGAPAGAYKVTYTPPINDQTAGGQSTSIEYPKPVTVTAGENDLPIELPAKK